MDAREESRKDNMYLSFISSFQGIAFRSDNDFNPIFIHGAVEAVTGYSEEDILAGNPSWDEIIHPEDRPKGVRHKKSNRISLPTTPTFRIIRKDGMIRWLEQSISVLKDDSGKPEFFHGTLIDVTDKIIAQQALKESEAAYRNLVEQNITGLMIIEGPIPKIIYANPAISKIIGYKVDELSQMSSEKVINLIHSEYRKTILENFRASLRGEDVPTEFEIRIIRKDGEIRWTRMSANRIRYSRKVVIQATFQDVTERVRFREALLHREREYRELIEELPEGIGVSDLEETLVFVNKAFADMLGYSPSEMVGKNVLELTEISSHDTVISESRIRVKGEKSTYELEMACKSGEKRIIRVSAIPRHDKEGNVDGSIAVCTDVTRRHRMEEEIKQQRREAELYASLLRHDVGNDLQVVLGYIEAIQMFSSDLTGTASDMVESALASAERMAQLVKAFDHLKQPVESNIVTLLRRIAEKAERVYRGLEVKISISKEAENLRIAGSSLLPMCFENLLRNSAQHAGERPVVEIEVSKEGDQAVIVMTDNGPGISEDVKTDIFKRGASTKDGGLGLYLSRQIIWACGGKIDLMEPKERNGATFEIRLPLII